MADKKKFEIPEIADDADLESIEASIAEAQGYLTETGAGDGDLDVEALEHIEAVLAFVDGAKERAGAIVAEQEAVDARLAAARERIAGLAKTDEVVAEDEAPEGADAEVVDAEAEVVEQEPVLASGTRRATVARAARRAPEVIIPKDQEQPKRQTVVKAAANVPDHTQGQVIKTVDDLAGAFLALTGSFGARGVDHFGTKGRKTQVRELTKNANRKGVARIIRDESEFSVDREMSLEKQMEIIAAAGDEAKRFGSFGAMALTAAGGWCAPSETIYDLFSYHTGAGTIDIPEVTARRGGISFTKGPDFMTIFGDVDAGWSMTEAQAEAGTFTKPCFALDCPPFQEVRLDAIGFCATAPLLTEAAYPELVRMVLSMLAAGHERRKSAATISRISTLIGAGVTFAPVGAAGNQSGLADTLAAAELRANQIRQTLAMDPKATVEGLFPYWARGVFRTELSRRLGLANPFGVTDADVDGWFALRGIRNQYVYDYQMLNTSAVTAAGGTAAWTAWPQILEFMMWPAGAFTRLVHDVINLDAVYDHDLLTQNEYTAAFMEEGFAVANTRGFGLKTSVALNPEGLTGASSIGYTGAGLTVG